MPNFRNHPDSDPRHKKKPGYFSNLFAKITCFPAWRLCDAPRLISNMATSGKLVSAQDALAVMGKIGKIFNIRSLDNSAAAHAIIGGWMSQSLHLPIATIPHKTLNMPTSVSWFVLSVTSCIYIALSVCLLLLWSYLYHLCLTICTVCLCPSMCVPVYSVDTVSPGLQLHRCDRIRYCSAKYPIWGQPISSKAPSRGAQWKQQHVQ